jgi:hypothetical protein
MADVTELLHSARRAVEAGDHRTALPLLDEAVKLGPDLFGVHMLRGVCLSALGRHAEGVKALQRAIELNPTSAQGHYNLAVALRSARRPKEGEQHFRRALRLQPGYEAAAEALRPAPAARSREANAQVVRPPSAPASPAPPEPERPQPRQQDQQPPRPSKEPSGKAGRRYLKWAAIAGMAALVTLAAVWLPFGRGKANFVAWQAAGDFAALDFSPDGELLAAAGKKVTLWRVRNGVRYRDFGWGEEAIDLAFLPSGTAIAVSSRDEKTGRNVKLWRMPDSGLVAVLPQTVGNRPLVFSPDGKLLAIGTDYMSTASPLGVQLWSVPDRKLAGAVATPDPVAPGYVTAIAFSPDGKLLVSADDSGTIWITDLADRKQLRTIQSDNMVTVSVAFSPSGKTLAYGGSSGPNVTICSLPDGRPVETLKGDSRARGKLGLPPAIKAIAFSPDGGLLAACESAGDLVRVEVFRVTDGALLKTIDPSRLFASSPPRLIELRDLQFSRDGRYLAWCGSQGVVVARVDALAR